MFARLRTRKYARVVYDVFEENGLFHLDIFVFVIFFMKRLFFHFLTKFFFVSLEPEHEKRTNVS